MKEPIDPAADADQQEKGKIGQATVQSCPNQPKLYQPKKTPTKVRKMARQVIRIGRFVGEVADNERQSADNQENRPEGFQSHAGDIEILQQEPDTDQDQVTAGMIGRERCSP